jgi:hypothetical protein
MRCTLHCPSPASLLGKVCSLKPARRGVSPEGACLLRAKTRGIRKASSSTQGARARIGGAPFVLHPHAVLRLTRLPPSPVRPTLYALRLDFPSSCYVRVHIWMIRPAALIPVLLLERTRARR